MSRGYREGSHIRLLTAASLVGPLLLAVPAAAQEPPADDPSFSNEEAVSDEEWEQASPAERDAAAEDEAARPAISDSEFEDTLPELEDDALDDLLARAPEAAPRADAPPLDDPDLEELRRIQPVEIDPEALARTLTPIEFFALTDLPPPNDEAAEPMDEVRYYLVTEGFEQVGLEDDFLDYSALEEGDGASDNAAMLRARANADGELAERLFRSRGYFDATVSSEVILPPEADGRYRVVVAATPGEQYTFSDVSVVGEDEAIPPGLVSDNMPLEAGDPVVADDVIAAEASVSLVFPFNGYPFAEVEQHAILLDEESKTADYVLPVDLGPRSRFDDIIVEGDEVFDPEHVKLLSRFEEGDLYDVRLQDDLREAMIATSLFNSVSIEPVQTGEYNEDGTMDVDLLVRQAEGPPRSLTAEVGYGTGEGARIEGAWIHRNLFPPEGALEARATAGTREQAASLFFRRSNAGARDRTVLLGAEAGRSDFPAYNAYSLAFRGRISRESTPIWQKKWAYTYGAELIATNEDQMGDPAIFDFDTAYLIGAVPGQLTYDASNDLLNPTRGWKASVRVSPEAALGDGGFRPYVSARGDVFGYFPINEDFTLAGRVRLGTIQGIGRDELAPSRRFYGGGGGSVRGYGFQDLTPREEILVPPTEEELEEDPDAEPTIDYIRLGGRSTNEVAIEARYRFGNFGVVGFLDAGQVYESTIPDFSGLQYGAGIGGRYYTNFGPFRADIAIPLNPKFDQADFAIYVSIGQAF